MYIKKSNHITATSQQKPIDFEYTSSGQHETSTYKKTVQKTLFKIDKLIKKKHS